MKVTCKVLFVFLVSQLTWATPIPIININNLSGQYLFPEGTATADSFIFENRNFGDDAIFSIFKQAGIFFLKTPEEEIQLENLPDAVNKLDSAEFENVNISSTTSEINFSLKSLKGKTIFRELILTDLKAQCEEVSDRSDVIDNVLDGCFNNSGKASLSYVKIQDNSFKNLRVSVKDNILYFEGKVFGIKAKGYGESYYDESGNKIRIKIRKVKAGFLNVTSKVFNQLKAKESARFIVNRPWIEILLDEEI